MNEQITLWDWSPEDCPKKQEAGSDWRSADDRPEHPGPTIVIFRRNNPILHDEDFNAGNRTNVIDCGDHYFEIAQRWFNGRCWAGFREEVIMWQPLPEFPTGFPFDLSKHMNPPEEK